MPAQLQPRGSDFRPASMCCLVVTKRAAAACDPRRCGRRKGTRQWQTLLSPHRAVAAMA